MSAMYVQGNTTLKGFCNEGIVLEFNEFYNEDSGSRVQWVLL